MPSGTRSNPYDNVNTADLYTVKFDNLFDRDEQELETLLKACDRDGFFYLDLQGSGSEKLWKDLDRVGKITKRWFAQPVEVKQKTPTVSLAHGFVYCLTFFRLMTQLTTLKPGSRPPVTNPEQLSRSKMASKL